MPSLSKLFKAATTNVSSPSHHHDCHSNDLETTTAPETDTSVVRQQPEPFKLVRPPKQSNDLEITTAPETDTSVVRQQPEPFKLARPPKQSHINPIIGRPYIQYYGYAIPNDWLIRFAEKECPEMLPERDHKCYERDAMLRAREFISARSGVWSFDFKFCFNPKDGEVPLLWFEAFMAKYFKSGDDEIRAVQIDTVPVLAVCSEQDDSFKERPTQEQMDVLTQLIGYAPRWWVCCDYD
ncbi:hypothetical protein EV424DRAFT_268553 [Suillus variegatus]|nr:hypothetical protein EV424DRAFT_268553 [Suillus variegatus]